MWQESLALLAGGYEVVVVCPQGGRHTQRHEVIDGVEIHRYPLRPAVGGTFAYLREYGQAIWRSFRIASRLGRFDVVHACNPPDLLFLVALPLKLRGAKFVFDQHDLVPELYLSRFGDRKDAVYRALLVLERLSFGLADVVIATNETYARIAVERGRKRRDRVFVVRNGPDLERVRPTAPDETLKRGKPHLLCYLGVMGPQDGVDYALRALALLRERRSDWHAAFIGDGDAHDAMVGLAGELRLDDLVTFTGRLPDESVMRYLSTADVCLAPDPVSPLNDASTMTKIMEYMALSRPIVSFDLRETRTSAGDAAVYAPGNDESAFADLVHRLLDDPSERERLGRLGRERVETALSWDHSRPALLASYARALAADGDGA